MRLKAEYPLASTGFRGLLNKLSGVASQFLSGDGSFRNPLNPVQTDILFTDGVNDIGKTGATRPRDLFVSRNMELGGNLNSDLKFTDATFDIGKSAATRPRDLFLSRNAVVGGTLGVTGVTTLSASLDISGASAGQISFPAAQNPSAGANVLDDYEEGTWTPSDASGAALTLVVGVAQYIKIGKVVHAWTSLSYPVTASGVAAKIGGLPFTCDAAQLGSGAVGFSDAATPPTQLLVRNNTTNIELFAGSGVAVTNTNVSNKSIIFTVTYKASA